MQSPAMQTPTMQSATIRFRLRRGRAGGLTGGPAVHSGASQSNCGPAGGRRLSAGGRSRFRPGHASRNPPIDRYPSFAIST